MPMSKRENFLRNASTKGHEWIPARVVISGASWRQDREGFENVCRRHPTIFPGFRGPPAEPDRPRQSAGPRIEVDEWGCKWGFEIEGLAGALLESPLDDWAKRQAWSPPAPPAFDQQKRDDLAAQRRRGDVVTCHLRHGFFFMRLFYLRGYDNFMADVAAEEARLDELAEIVARYNECIIGPYLRAGIDLLRGGDDLGSQKRSMLGAKHFRRWVQPTYSRLFAPARAAGAHVYLHSDGYILDIADEIIESGVTILNPQDLLNGVDAIAREIKGRVCVDLDVDRQRIVPFGGASEIRDLIKEEVMKLGSPAGGLMFMAGIYPPTPPRNVDALCSALEEFRTYWVGR